MNGVQIGESGVYIHVPFCERLCPYCDFAVSVQAEIPHREYGAALMAELDRRQGELGSRKVGTIYFGGGTPSLLAPEILNELVERVGSIFEMASNVEVTLEANPNQITGERLEQWREGGINRLSIGCQSFQDRHLKALRRNHDSAMAREAVSLAMKKMKRVSLDLMFAGPSQSKKEWEEDLEVLRELAEEGLDHLSGYNLTIEEGTAFWIRRKRGTVVVPGEEVAAEMLEGLVEVATSVGLKRYEVSNFAVPGGESRHNSGYWRGRPYLGVGMGAHSLEVLSDGSARRRANSRRYGEYMAGAKATVEELSPEAHFGERLFLGVRSSFGLDLDALQGQFGAKVGEEAFHRAEVELRALAEEGLLARDGRRFWPTNRGLNVSDGLAARLI